MIVSDSPPELPGAQCEYESAVSIASNPWSTNASRMEKAVGWSTVQPKTLVPSTSGAMEKPVEPSGRDWGMGRAIG